MRSPSSESDSDLAVSPEDTRTKFDVPSLENTGLKPLHGASYSNLTSDPNNTTTIGDIVYD